MSATLTIRDQTTTGATAHELVIDFLTERITVRELIRSRVYQEVQDYNVKRAGRFNGLVQPSDAERELNGYRLKPGKPIDWKPQFDAAVEAFGRASVIILVDDQQAESLDQEIVITPKTTVSFLKLVPLVGG